MEERLHAISNEKEKQTLQHAQVVSKLENELAVLKNEVDVLHQVLKERGVTPPETGKSNGLDAEGKAKKLAPLKSSIPSSIISSLYYSSSKRWSQTNSRCNSQEWKT